MPKTKLNNIVKRYIDIYLLKNIIQYQIYHLNMTLSSLFA